MGSLLVRATFGERAAGRFALQRGKRSSENGVQTTFWVDGEVVLEIPRAYHTSPTHGFQVWHDL